MNWEAPSFVVIKMDAEINSYQDDLRDDTEAEEPSNNKPASVFVANNSGST